MQASPWNLVLTDLQANNAVFAASANFIPERFLIVPSGAGPEVPASRFDTVKEEWGGFVSGERP